MCTIDDLTVDAQVHGNDLRAVKAENERIDNMSIEELKAEFEGEK